HKPAQPCLEEGRWASCQRRCLVIRSDSRTKTPQNGGHRMNRNIFSISFLVFTLAALVSCSSKPPANKSKQALTAPDKIQGKAQVMAESTVTDAAMNAGGPSVY